MANDITVVRVAREPLGTASFALRVYFSAPVQLRGLVEQDSWWAEGNPVDELDAYVWGLKVIEKHKEMENAQKP